MARNKNGDGKTSGGGEAKREADSGPGFQDRITRPFVLIGQIIWLFFDVATLMLRMLIYTVLYDTPHGKHEMTLDTGSREKES